MHRADRQESWLLGTCFFPKWIFTASARGRRWRPFARLAQAVMTQKGGNPRFDFANAKDKAFRCPRGAADCTSGVAHGNVRSSGPEIWKVLISRRGGGKGEHCD